MYASHYCLHHLRLTMLLIIYMMTLAFNLRTNGLNTFQCSHFIFSEAGFKDELLLYWLLYSDRFTSYLIMALIPYH